MSKRKLAELVERVLQHRRLRAREPDFKRFLRAAPDFELLKLTRQDESSANGR